MKRRIALALGAALLALPSQAKDLCTILADVTSGNILTETGDCRARVTPASTFKIALAAIGFDSGFLRDAKSPALPWQPGYPAWGGAQWRRTTDPAHWMKHSVVWYSQEITASLGLDRLARYAAAFDYGNADVSGDPGKNNGLERSWIGSSLKISPLEQTVFLSDLINRRLPIKPSVFEKVEALLEPVPLEGGWIVRGKTGSAFPRRADGTLDRERGYGWFVGWAVRGEETSVFARLAQDERRQSVPGGLRARDAMLKDLPALLAGTPSATQAGGAVGDWPKEKCARYRKGWADLVARSGTGGFGADFLQAHDAFLASDCLAKANVCPRSPKELEAANALTLIAMNAGMASTFLPFNCSR